MTRTFVVGDVPDEVAEWHRLASEALDARARRRSARVSPASRSTTASATSSRAAGYPTQRTKAEGESLADGFFHSLGHGVGLEVHEQPMLGMAGHEELVAGDVLASSRACTARATAAAASRTSCSSPRTAPRPDATSRTT